MQAYHEIDAATSRLQNPIIRNAYQFRIYIENGNSYRDARCKFCKKEFKKAKPARLIEHSLKCADTPEDIQLRLNAPSGRLSNADQEIIDKLLVKFIATNCIALNTLDTSITKKLFSSLSPSYRLPSRYVFTNRMLPRQAVETRDFCIENIINAPDYKYLRA